MENSKKFEYWEVYDPINISKKYYVNKIIKDINFFSILMEEEHDCSKLIKFLFNDSLVSYRISDETYRIETLENIDIIQPGFKMKGFCFKINNSNYIDWLLSNKDFTTEENNFLHFVFIDDFHFIDVIAIDYPKIEIIKEKTKKNEN